jgi:hypothetical protein
MTEDKAENMQMLAESINPKPARALYLWLAVICIVLAMLWFETRHKPSNINNLLLNGEAEAVGATVSIDGKNVGVMEPTNSTGVDGSAFWWHLRDGKHAIEVKKPGFDPFSKDINLKHQGYVGVVLKASQTGK